MAKALRERLKRPLNFFLLLAGLLLPLGLKVLSGAEFSGSFSLARLARSVASAAPPAAAPAAGPAGSRPSAAPPVRLALPAALATSTLAAPRADLWGRPMADPAGLPIVPGATWRYFKGIVSAPPAAWKTAGFDDSAWDSGASGFGFGDGDDATDLADMQNAYTSVYIRKEFTLADLTGVGGLTVTIDYDDAFVLYVNGAEAARSASMGGTPGVPPAYNAPAAASHEASGGNSSPQPPDVLTIPVASLVVGTNVIAIEGHNQSIGSGDFSLLPTVEILNASPSAPSGASPAPGAVGVSTSPQLCVTVSDPEGGPLSVDFHGREAGGAAGADFTVVALPDTQYYSASHPATFQTQTAWIRDNRIARDIVMVTSLGDCVDDASVQTQWDNASIAYSLLEDPATTGLPHGIPFGVAVGNHDQDPNGFARIIADENVTTTLYNQTFPKSRFAGRGYFGGNYAQPGFADSMDNHYELWSASGMDFVTFHLEWDDSGCSWPASGAEPAGNLSTCQQVIKWTRTLLAGPLAGRRAMIITHFMGTPTADGTGTLAFSTQGQAILNGVRPLPNVFLMLGGHLDQADHRTDLAVDGHAITTLVSDYQTRPNGGDGWLRIMTFKPQAGQIHVETYSPLLGRYINKLADGTPNSHPDNLAPSENEITVAYPMDAGSPFAAVGNDANVPSGLSACVTWAGLRAGTAYEWYATVTDGVNATTGARQTFTTTNACTQTSECDDGNPCTTDACNGTTSLCEHAAIGNCCVVAADCNDGNVCTDDACTANQCAHAANIAACSDGDACTSGDLCSGGACSGGPAPNCDDANACTADACAPATGCTHTRAEFAGCCVTNAHCDDGNAATLDQCDGGACTHEVNPACDTDADCDDSNVCTSEICSGGGYSLGLNGSTQYVTMGAAPGLGTGSFTLEAWIKWNGPGTGATASSGNGGVVAIPIVAKGRGEDDGSNVDANYFFGIDGNARLTADFESIDAPVNGNNNYPVLSTTAVTANLWHHVAVTYDAPPGTGCWDLYLDGVVVTDPAGRCPNTTPRYDSIQHFGLGTALNSAGDTAGRFAGRLDEARVWSVARTAAQIQAGMSQPIPAAVGLLGRWGFDDGATATDSAAPPAENGALVGAPSFSAADKPSIGAGQCQYTILSCDDGNTCTTDACDPILGCAHAPAHEGAACSDGDACTSFDVCASGVCEGQDNGQCCTQDSECDDGNPCTANTCNVANGAALQFDGVNDTVDLGTAAAINNLGTGSFTIEGWMETDGGNNDLTGVFRWGRQLAFPQVVVQLSGGGAPYRNLRASVETNQVSPTTQVDTPITTATLVPVNAWTHFALVADRTPGAQELRLYLNGDLASAAPANLWGTNPIATTDSTTLGAARLGDGTLGLFFDGRLDEVRMWSVARSEAEIEAGMGQQIDAAPGLLARWGMNEGAGVVTGESVSHTNAAVNGAAWSTSALVPFGAGLCQYLPLSGNACDDGDACTVNDTCNVGACASGGPRNCNDLNGCTDDACDDESGCVHTNNTASCSDGNACTTGDVCSDGACAGGSLVSCDDGSACTIDACNPSTGCTHTSISCDDGNPCTADSCDAVLGCRHTALADGTACSDGNACTAGDACALGVCVAGPAASCDDGNPCTDDSCTPATGCAHANNTAACSDGNPCTTGDVCGGGACTGTPLFCNDGDPCTDDACSGGTCVFTPSASVCSDGVTCTSDVCTAGPASGALQFNGSDTTPQYVTMGTGTPRLGLSRFTVEAWVKWDGGGTVTNTGTGGFATNGSGGAIPIVTRGRGEADGSNVDANYFLGIKNGLLVADFEEGVGGAGPLGLNHPVCGSTVLDTTTWHHVAAAYDGACWQLYVDGSPETLSTACSSCAQTGACNICPGQPPRSDSIQHFSIGSALNSTGAPEGDFQGRIDEVRVWNFARSAAEIGATRDKRVQQSLGLVGRWGLDEAAGATAADSTGGGVNGTLVNSPAWTTGSPGLGAALCSNAPSAACCAQASDCDDANACTADSCDLVTHACTNTPVSGSCDDGNGCTTGDTCSGGVCTGTGVPNCCQTDAQCADGSTCTSDICRLANVSALQFDGGNDYVTMGPALGPTGLGLAQFTLEGWIQWTGGGAVASTGVGGLSAIPIITKGRGEEDGSEVDANYFLGIVNGRLAADFEQKDASIGPTAPAGQNRPICGSIDLPVGAWAHVAVTYDGTWHLYVNGVEGTDATGTACTAPACDPLICKQSPGVEPRFDSIQHFGLGTAMNSAGVTAGAFAGQMDEVRVWNRALSAIEIGTAMNTQLVSGAGLVARWGMNENSGGTAADSVGPSLENGTLLPGSTDRPAWVTAGIPNLGDNTCGHLPANDGGSCSDGSDCTSGEVCSGGLCGGGFPVSCDDGNPCTTDSCNAAGGCQHAPVVCNDGDACTTDSCNPTTGQCQYAPLSCGDGNACNGVETCSAGACVPGTPVVCAASDQCHDAGTCDPATGVCSSPAKTDGTLCSDGNACTQSDTCQAGVCTGTNPVTCTASDQCHDAGTCDPATGVCSSPAKTDGTLCSDGNACTQSDTCQAGVCTGTSPVTCTASDQCHVAGTCDPATGVCSSPAKVDGTLCSDGNACTQSDTCQAGVCTGTNPVTCTASDQCHDAGICDPATGVCSSPAKTDGTLCSDGNACTQSDTCQAGVCTGTNPVTCTASDQCHDAGTCDPATGVCSSPAKADGTLCSDGNACTQSDTCQAGVCTGMNPVTCTASDQCHDTGVCEPATGVCSSPAKTDGTLCSDGNACTQSDTCQAGVCTGMNPVTCTASDQCHVAGTCDPATGVCSSPAKADGTLCSDGNACTQSDTCQAGVCTGMNPVTCTASDQCHVAGTCDPATGVCSNPAKVDGTLCSDGNACTQSDTCQAGVCTGTNPVTCTASDQCHDAGTCDPATGVCSSPAKTDGTLCSDGSACTQSDACQAGVCTGTNPVTCTASDQCHDAGVCEPATGVCSSPAKTDGTLCSDGSACTQSDTCQAGVCTGTNPVTCTASDQCHDTGVCDPATGVCSSPAKIDGTLCSDGSACTQSDTCQAGVCSGASPVTCTASDQCHDAGVCEPATGVCSNPAKADGTLCSDGNACTQSDTCQAGVCTGTNPVACTASDQCHDAGICDPATGVCSNPAKTDGTLCSDGNACTQSDTCQAGVCSGASPVTCTASDQCHDAGVCDPATGVCSSPAKTDGTLCSDGNACTQSDTCQAGVCTGTNPVTCTASDQCHDAGICDPATGVCSSPAKTDGTLCSDGSACTQSDTCQAGVCTGTNPVTCTASDQCHDAGVCEPATGVCSSPAKTDGTLCSDGSACTQSDACQAGVCTGTNPVTCTASDQCHDAGVCEPATGVCSSPAKTDGTLCSDGSACTQSDTCQAGVCTGTNPVTCTASDQCHDAGVCDPATGVCSSPIAANGTPCTDGNGCTQSDACEEGTCTSGTPVICVASDQCHVAGLCDPGTGACSNPPAADGTSCSDANVCTQGESCAAGVCSGGTQIVTAEVNDTVTLTDDGVTTTLTWDDPPGEYNVYRGVRSTIETWEYNQACFATHLASGTTTDAGVPNVGDVYFYFVTRLGVCGESVGSRDSGGAPYPNPAPCP